MIQMKEKLRTPTTDLLFQAILTLNSIDECYAFFEDICTISELQALVQRLEVAILLRQGKTYIEVGKETGASTATISRVNRCINYGTDGYQMILERLEHQTEIEGEEK